MKIQWSEHLRANIHTILQEAGYHAFYDRRSDSSSYILRFGGDFYPRFHLYIEGDDPDIILDLHIDQKPSSLGNRRHAGEYSGSMVEEEAARLKRWLRYFRVSG